MAASSKLMITEAERRFPMRIRIAAAIYFADIALSRGVRGEVVPAPPARHHKGALW